MLIAAAIASGIVPVKKRQIIPPGSGTFTASAKLFGPSVHVRMWAAGSPSSGGSGAQSGGAGGGCLEFDYAMAPLGTAAYTSGASGNDSVWADWTAKTGAAANTVGTGTLVKNDTGKAGGASNSSGSSNTHVAGGTSNGGAAGGGGGGASGEDSDGFGGPGGIGAYGDGTARARGARGQCPAGGAGGSGNTGGIETSTIPGGDGLIIVDWMEYP